MILNIPKNITDQLFFRDFVFFAHCDNVFFAQCDNDGHEQYSFVIFMYFLQVSQDKGMEAEPVVDARQPGQRREERCVRRSGCF